jgi:hypothetical protein
MFKAELGGVSEYKSSFMTWNESIFINVFAQNASAFKDLLKYVFRGIFVYLAVGGQQRRSGHRK